MAPVFHWPFVRREFGILFVEFMAQSNRNDIKRNGSHPPIEFLAED